MLHPHIKIEGKYSYGMDGIILHHWGEKTYLRIGSFCSIADKVEIFLGGNHKTDWFTTYPFGHINQTTFSFSNSEHPGTNGDVIIGNDVWIGYGASIMSGVKIGHGAVIAAKAHVTKDVEPYTIVGGNPAREIRKRFSPEIISILLQLKWWDWEDSKIQKYLPLLCSSDEEKLKDLL
jgi:acetyltransferase-like isoleucine patch superfamily enzyme